MRNFAILAAGSLLLFTFTGCTSVKRFKTADFKGQDNNLADVQLFNARLSAEQLIVQDRNLWTLSANAQTRLVQILDERYADNERFMGALSGNYGAGEEPLLELTRKDLRMVFTISKMRDYSLLKDPSGRFSPADRIEYMKLKLEIPDTYRLRFHEWNRYSTEYGEIDIADVSFSRSIDLSVDGSPGGADMGSDATLGRNEKQVVSQRYLKLNGSISDHMAVIEAEGTREVDLTGNVSADVALLFDGFHEIVMQPVFVDAGAGRTELAALNFLDVIVPAMREAPDTLYAMLTMEYIYRHVQSGWQTFAEWDDKVEYYQGKVSKLVPLFLKRDYLPRFFSIGTEHGDTNSLKIRTNADKEYLLQFKSYTDASRFLDWFTDPFPGVSDSLPSVSGNLLLHGDPIFPGDEIVTQLKVLSVY